MDSWFEIITVLLLSLLGIFLGRRFCGFRKPYWLLGYFLSLLLIAALLIDRYTNSTFLSPFFWLTVSRAKFALFALAVTMGLTTPLSRLPYKFEKVIICILMAAIVVWFSILPFLAPVFVKNELLNLKTMIDSGGTCFQSKSYTCGPAAAVTALKRLGLDAREGEIAVLAHSSPVAGTIPICLYSALQNRYGIYGLKCRYRHFDSILQLKDAGITLAVVKDTFLSDHCVTVLEVSDQMVTFADPVFGKQSLSYKQFEKVWRFTGIVLKRDFAGAQPNWPI
jgi:uncharacterized protein